MSRFHLTGTSRALYRVFVAPNLPPSRPNLICAPTNPSRATPLISQIPKRMVYFKVKQVQRLTAKDFFTFDNDIEASEVNLVDLDGAFRTNVRTTDALRQYNRVTHHLLLVNKGTVDEFGMSDPNDMPTCKIISKIDLRDQFQKKLELKQKEEAGKLGAVSSDAKQLELNWAIERGDLTHRLSKLQEFLNEGKKVEVVFKSKRKRGRPVSKEEADALIKAARDAALECKGARETKDPDGNVGGLMTLFFEGTDLSEKKPVKVKDVTERPLKSKFKEKFEKKMQEEEEQREERRREEMERRMTRGPRQPKQSRREWNPAQRGMPRVFR